MSSRPKRKSPTPTRKPANMGAQRPARDVGEICHGTVGFDDGQDHFTIKDERPAYIKVTLFQGYNPDTQGPNPDGSVARGREVLVRYDPTMGKIPPRGAHVIVARPAGMAECAGAFFLIGVTAPDRKWFPNRKSDEQMLYGPNGSFVRFKEDGTLYGFCSSGDEANGAPVQFELSPHGFRVNHPHGEAYCDTDGFGLAHSSGALISGGAIAGLSAPFDAYGSFVNVRAAIARLDVGMLTIGPNSGQDNLLHATPALATLTAIQTALSALRTWANAVGVDLHTLAAALAIPALTQDTPLLAVGAAVTASGGAVTACTTYGPTNCCTAS